MTRLTAEFWVHAYLARLRLVGIPAFVVAHGDDTGGAVLVKLNTLDGQATVYERQRRTDPDLWVIEVEDRAGRHLLDEPGLSD